MTSKRTSAVESHLRSQASKYDAEAAAAYLAAIVDSAEDAILSKSLDGIIQSCNAAAERMFGYSAAELVGKPVRILIPPERQSEEDEILARIRRGQRIEHFETIRLRKDGSRVEIALTISPVRDAKGSIIGASKIARDITDLKRAEAERIRLLEENLGVRLLHRTTRRVTVSEEGERVYQWAQQIFETLQRMDDDLNAGQREPVGQLRIASSLGLGRRFVAPALSELAARYPRLDIRLDVHDRLVDLIAEGVDTTEKMALLAAAGCDFYQGYLISRPLTQEELGVWAMQRLMEKARESAQQGRRATA